MKVFKLLIHNFGSYYGMHEIPMSDLGLVFVRGQNLDETRSPSNGAGKSTIFDALDWCLFGEVPRGGTVKSIVNDEAKKDCWVIAYLEDAGHWYCVYRYRQVQKESGVKFYSLANQNPAGQAGKVEGWKTHTMMDEKVTQAEIEKALGLDRTIFRAAVYRAQNEEKGFAEATEGERKELLTSLIPELAEVDALKTKAQKLLSQAQQERASLQGMLQQAQNEMAGLQALNWSEQEAMWRQENERKQVEALFQYDAAQKQLAEAQKLLAWLPSIQQQLQQLQQPQAIDSWGPEVEKRIAVRAEKQAARAVLQNQYAELQAELKKFSALQSGVKCSKCGVVVTGEHLQKEMADLVAKLELVKGAGLNAKAELQQAEISVEDAKAHRAKEAEHNAKVMADFGQQRGQLQQQLQQLNQLQQQLNQLQHNVSGWGYQITTLQNEKWPGEAAMAAAEKRANELGEFLLLKTAAIAALEKREKILLFWLDGLTAKGMKNLIMDSRIEEMTLAANSWLQAITGGTTWIRFETQKMKGDGKLSEKINIRVFRHNPDGTITERDFDTWSGGEKTRIARGVDQGLKKLITDRATKAWDLQILDESFCRGLDAGGREALFEQIQKLSGTVFVVDHTDLGGYFEKSLDVRIQNRRSTVSFGGVSCSNPPSAPQSYLPGVSLGSISAPTTPPSYA